MLFTDLNLTKPILKSLSDLEYTRATVIQEKALPAVLSGKDVIGIAQTGTGKTLAYLLPSISQWKFSKEPHPQIVVLVPTRELVLQVVHESEKISTYQNIVIRGVYGGTNINTQHDILVQGVDVLIATPGRLRDLILKGSLRLKNVKKLIIDEVDEMLNLGFRHQLIKLFDFFPERRQNLMFSATLSPEVEELIDDYFVLPIKVEAAPTGTPLENIQQSSYETKNFNTKLNLSEYLLSDRITFSKVLIFTASKKMAEILFEKITTLFPEETGIIHSNKSQNNRFLTVKNFQNGTFRILIATDLVARGIDISEVSHVINFDIPEQPEVYIHRIGRTGRADKKGESISFFTAKDREKRLAIEQLMEMGIRSITIPEDVPISNELAEFEKETILSPNIELSIPKNADASPAFQKAINKIKSKKKRKEKNPVKKFVRTPKRNKGKNKQK